jgi:hypothetical protein
MKIEIADVRVRGSELVFKLDYSKPLRKYFLGNTFFVQYDSEVNVGDIDKSILVIPIISVVSPIAWAVGADIKVDTIDETYLHCLAKVRDVFKNFYPQFSFSSNIEVKDIVRNQLGGKRTGLLFGGGLDSLTSYLRHKDERPDLIFVWGAEFRLYQGEALNEASESIRRIKNRDEIMLFQVKTNLREINERLLGSEFKVDWYCRVSHGLMLLGMCPPISAARGLATIIIASSHTKEFKAPWGSHPLIDNNISWADVRVVHDGYELSRQQKLKYLAQRSQEYLSYLRVCGFSALGRNCLNCEKCFRTIVGLTLERIDPRECNFHVDSDIFARIKDCFLKGRITLGEDELFMWQDIQQYIPQEINNDINGSSEFLTWLKNFDLSQYKENRLRAFLWITRSRFRKGEGIIPFIKWAIKCYFYLALARMRWLV